MIAALLLVALPQAEALSRAIAEHDREKRREILAPLRKIPLVDIETAARNPRRGPSPWEPGRITLRTSPIEEEETFSYAVHVPAAYDPSAPRPLLVTLHGTNLAGDTDAGRRWLATWVSCESARDGFVIVAPTTIRHTWASRQGHGIVQTVIREVSDVLSVDPDRVYVDGMSMGAGGAFRLAEHHPDRWAAIGPRCNVPDVRQKQDKTFVTMLADNLRAVPIWWVVGARDEKIPVEMARAARREIEGPNLVYREFAEGGHDWRLEKDDDVLAWYGKRRRVPYPAEVVFKSWEKSFPRAFWIEILSRTEKTPIVVVHLDMAGKESERRTEYRPPAIVRAKRTDQSIEIACEEVRELRVWLDDAMVDLDKPVAITVNGRKLHDGVVKRSLDVLVDDLRKRRDPGMTFTAFVDLKPGQK